MFNIGLDKNAPLGYHYYSCVCGAFLFEKLIGAQLVKKFPVWYGTWRFIAIFM